MASVGLTNQLGCDPLLEAVLKCVIHHKKIIILKPPSVLVCSPSLFKTS